MKFGEQKNIYRYSTVVEKFRNQIFKPLTFSEAEISKKMKSVKREEELSLHHFSSNF